MKRTILLLLALIAVSLTGCKNTLDDKSAYEKIHKELLTMKSYEAMTTVTYISNKSQHVYQTKHQARMSGEYRIEVVGPERVAGNITLNDNKVIVQFNTQVRDRFAAIPAETPERLELFLTSFVKNYAKSQQQSVSVASIEESVCTVLEATIPGSHPFLASEKLWVSNETLKPVKMVIYDPDGAERIVITFESFEYNVEFDDRLFKLG